jgi:hypothetical protein
MTTPSETADDMRMMSDDDQSMPERSSDPGGLLVTENPRPPAQAEVWSPIGAPAGSAAGSDAEVPVAAGQADAEDPPAFPAPDAEPVSLPDPPAVSDTASSATGWHEVMAMFVDDPHASAEMAASLVDDEIQALVASLKGEQDSLLAAWHGEDAGTEELRTTVQNYHALGNRLADFKESHA